VSYLNRAPRCREHNLWLVAVCVSDFCDLNGVDRSNDYFAAGQLKLVELFDRDDEGNLLVDDNGTALLSKPIPYVRRAIKNAITENWQTDRQLAIPRTTRRGMDKRGETPPDHTSHSLDALFDSKGYRPDAQRSDGTPDSSEWFSGDNTPGPGEDQWFAPECRYKQWSRIIETLEFVYSNCRDDLDRQIVEARLDGFASIDSDPVHEDDVALQLGITTYEVHERLNRLERRYYKQLDRIPPTKRQTQRAIARKETGAMV